MAIKLTDTGVIATSGRGASKTVTLSVSFAEIDAWARRMRRDEPRLWRRAYGRAITALKSQFKRVVSNAGGVDGVPKFKDFESFTRELRTATNRATPMGGVLADKSRIVAFKRNSWQIIGWPDALAEWAVKFQDGVGGDSSEAFLTDAKSRARLHRMGIRDVPRTYAHNPRRIIPEPFGSHVRRHLDEWARGAYYKSLAKEMAKK
ncbi:MAG: hypothetical protein IIZ06_07535 [Kiritimatiellae bacterium]|nr:hypothetical protein [Kiritimatiellia bacterium]